jgi:hypothetical protein
LSFFKAVFRVLRAVLKSLASYEALAVFKTSFSCVESILEKKEEKTRKRVMRSKEEEEEEERRNQEEKRNKQTHRSYQSVQDGN